MWKCLNSLTLASTDYCLFKNGLKRYCYFNFNFLILTTNEAEYFFCTQSLLWIICSCLWPTDYWFARTHSILRILNLSFILVTHIFKLLNRFCFIHFIFFVVKYINPLLLDITYRFNQKKKEKRKIKKERKKGRKEARFLNVLFWAPGPEAGGHRKSGRASCRERV